MFYIKICILQVLCGGKYSACHEHPDQPEFKSADIVVFGPSVLCVDERDAMMELMGRKAQCRCA